MLKVMGVYGHVMYYGSSMLVLAKTGYPGPDLLKRVPERYHCSTAKHTRMAARKMGAAGMMAEICPHSDVEELKRDPYANMPGVMGFLWRTRTQASKSRIVPASPAQR